MADCIDCEKIPRIQLDILSRTLLTAIERFYEDPVNQARFEDWLQSEEGKAYSRRNAERTAVP